MLSIHFFQKHLLAYCFHPYLPHIYHLKNTNDKLLIREEDFNLKLTVKTFKVPEETAQSTAFGYILKYHRRKNLLFLFYPSFYLSIFDVTKGRILAHFELKMGNKVFNMTSV